MYPHGQTRILLQQENDRLRAENRAMIQALASPLVCRCCNGPVASTEENDIRSRNALLRAELDALTNFVGRLNSCRSLFPAAAVTPSPVYAEMAMTTLAIKEVVSLARRGAPMWTPNEKLNLGEYYTRFFPWFARNSPVFVHEVSRASALIPVDASSLVTTLMNPVTWHKIFPSIIADVSIESQSQRFQVINADIMTQISSLISTRNVKLLRCSRHIENDTWVIADISMYFTSYAQNLRPRFMRFPSGYLIQQITNGVSKVTILDHWVYKADEIIHPFDNEDGAHKWLAALHRHYKNSSLVLSPSLDCRIPIFDPIRQTNLLNLSALMVYVFCTGVCGVTGQDWRRLYTDEIPKYYHRMFTRQARDSSGNPCVLISSSGMSGMQARPEVMLGLLHGANKQDIWNNLKAAGDMKEVIRIQRCPDPGNEVSVFNFQWTGSKEWYLIQETYLDASGAMIVHACVEAPSLAAIINGGDLSGVELLPCGFTIMPHGLQACVVTAGCQIKAGQVVMMATNHVANYLTDKVSHTMEEVQKALFFNRSTIEAS